MWFYVAGMFALLPLLYSLSIGPMFVLVTRDVVDDSVLQASYKPLESFIRMTHSRDWFRGYIRTWLVLTNTPVPAWFDP